MKSVYANIVLGMLLSTLSTSHGQVRTVYDNGITTVNNGRVNDLNFPVFLMNADDFTLSANERINQVNWLGAYKNGDMLPDAYDGFTLRFFSFSGGIPQTTAFATIVLGAVERHQTMQALLYGNPVYSYSAQFPDTQLPAGTYLISIMNSHAGDKQWLWADYDSPSGHCYSMLYEGSPWREFSGGGVAEFAFSIAVVPEPSEAALFLLGLLLFATPHIRFFRRRIHQCHSGFSSTARRS